jgi:hypothetical protein
MLDVMNHNDMNEMPKSLKMAMVFIDRVGFPIMAFLLMFYLCFKTLSDNTVVLIQVRETLVSLNSNLAKK